MEAEAKGYAAPIWITYKQALEHKAHVRKGEKGSLVVLLTEAAQELRHLMSSPAGNGMSDMEIALRTAASVLRDSVESGRMPSGAWLTVDVKLSYENAARQLERLA